MTSSAMDYPLKVETASAVQTPREERLPEIPPELESEWLLYKERCAYDQRLKHFSVGTQRAHFLMQMWDS